MKKLALKTVRYFDPSDDDHPIDEIIEKIGATLVSSSMCLFQCIFCYFLGLKNVSIITSLMFGTSLFFLYLLKYRLISEISFSRLQTFAFIFGIFIAYINAGLAVNPTIIWTPLTAVVSIILLGIKEGLIWNIITSSCFYIAMYIANKYNYHISEFNQTTTYIIGSSNFFSAPLTAALIFAYFYKKKNDQYEKQIPLIEMGKSTSFLLHEISKPISRIKNAPTQEDIEQVVNIFTLANSINANQSLIIRTKIDFKKLIDEILNEYHEYIEHYHIIINIPSKKVEINTNRELITIAIKNLIKNSIENNIQNKLETPIGIDYSETYFQISNSLIDESIQEEDILKPGHSSKNGNMGMGMVIVTGVLKNLNHRLKTEIDRKKMKIAFTIFF